MTTTKSILWPLLLLLASRSATALDAKAGVKSAPGSIDPALATTSSSSKDLRDVAEEERERLDGPERKDINDRFGEGQLDGSREINLNDIKVGLDELEKLVDGLENYREISVDCSIKKRGKCYSRKKDVKVSGGQCARKLDREIGRDINGLRREESEGLPEGLHDRRELGERRRGPRSRSRRGRRSRSTRGRRGRRRGRDLRAGDPEEGEYEDERRFFRRTGEEPGYSCKQERPEEEREERRVNHFILAQNPSQKDIKHQKKMLAMEVSSALKKIDTITKRRQNKLHAKKLTK